MGVGWYGVGVGRWGGKGRGRGEDTGRFWCFGFGELDVESGHNSSLVCLFI